MSEVYCETYVHVFPLRQSISHLGFFYIYFRLQMNLLYQNIGSCFPTWETAFHVQQTLQAFDYKTFEQTLAY